MSRHLSTLLRLALRGGALLGSLLAPLHGQQLTFSYTNGYVTSITADQPLNFTLQTNYLYSSIQIRIYDLYPANSVIDSGNTYAGFSLGKSGALLTGQSVNFAKWNATLGGNSVDGDMLVGINGSFNLLTGETFTFTGTGTAGGSQSAQVPVPTSGTYSAFLVSQADGSALSNAISLQVVGAPPAPVPEPATYASFAALGALALAGTRRRRRAA